MSNTFFQGGEKFSRRRKPPLVTGLALCILCGSYYPWAKMLPDT